jgi:enamine deaminase RidA (YjgF/YER057c/UK114 family)
MSSGLQRFSPPGGPTPVGQYSTVAVVSPAATVVYVAGLVPMDETGTLVGETFTEQADLVFKQLASTLAAAGSSMASVAFIRAFLVSEPDFPAFREARRRAFARHDLTTPPPGTTVIVQALAGGSLIELDAIATAETTP